MKIKDVVLAKHSREQTEKIIKYVGNDPVKFKELVGLIFKDEEIISQRASWPLSDIARKHPQLLSPYLKRMLQTLEKPVHDAVKRNIVRALENYDIPEKYLGLAANNCFALLENPQTAVGIKAFSMTVLFNICKKEPELANELKLIIESQWEEASAGIKSRGRKILRGLEKLV